MEWVLGCEGEEWGGGDAINSVSSPLSMGCPAPLAVSPSIRRLSKMGVTTGGVCSAASAAFPSLRRRELICLWDGTNWFVCVFSLCASTGMMWRGGVL